MQSKSANMAATSSAQDEAMSESPLVKYICKLLGLPPLYFQHTGPDVRRPRYGECVGCGVTSRALIEPTHVQQFY